MNDITCPGCGKAFKIDGSGYAEILKQVRDKEFDKAITDRLALAEAEKASALELAKAGKDAEIEKLKAALDAIGFGSGFLGEAKPSTRFSNMRSGYLGFL